MSPDQYGQQAFNNILYGVQAVQQAQDQSLRQKAFLAQQAQQVKEFGLREKMFDLDVKRFDLNSRYQNAMIQVQERNMIDWDAGNAVTPHLAKVQSELQNLSDPDAIRSYTADESFINELPPEQQGRARALYTSQVQATKDKLFAANGLAQLGKTTGLKLYENAYLLSDPAARLEAQSLGLNLVGGAQLNQESNEMLGRFLREIEAKKPLSATEVAAYGKVYDSNIDQETSLLKEYGKELEVVESDPLLLARNTSPEIQKQYEQRVAAVAAKYAPLISKARKEAADMKDILLKQRNMTNDQAEVPQPAQETPAEPQKMKASSVLPPMKPSERKQTPAKEPAPEAKQPTEAGTEIQDPENPKRQTIAENLSAISQSEKARLQKEYEKLASAQPYTGKDKLKAAAERARVSKLSELKSKIDQLP